MPTRNEHDRITPHMGITHRLAALRTLISLTRIHSHTKYNTRHDNNPREHTTTKRTAPLEHQSRIKNPTKYLLGNQFQPGWRTYLVIEPITTCEWQR